MKKYLLLVMMFIFIILLSGCKDNDAIKFKKDYESLNGIEKNKMVTRSVTIDEENPYVYTTGEEVVKKIENKGTFFLYIGDTMCPWCRSVIEMATKKSKEYGVSTIYYINIWDSEHNEIFRDKYEIGEDGNINKVIEGTEGYKKLLTYFDNVLDDYTLTDENNKEIKTGEKRIYAPNFFFVKDGKVIEKVEGISNKQTNPFGELTEEILKDEEEMFNSFFKLNISCSDKC